MLQVASSENKTNLAAEPEIATEEVEVTVVVVGAVQVVSMEPEEEENEDGGDLLKQVEESEETGDGEQSGKKGFCFVVFYFLREWFYGSVGKTRSKCVS